MIIKDLAALERFSKNFAEFLKPFLENDENIENRVIQGSPKDIFLLFKGGLAAGKTTTISMLIKALGVNSETSSPTFMGMHEYFFSLQPRGSLDSISESRQNIQLYHLDLYQKNIDLDSVLELMDSDSPQIWMIEWSEKLDQEILDYLHLKHTYIKTFEVELKVLEDDTRKLAIREIFKDSCDFKVDIEILNLRLKDYDDKIMAELEPILEEMAKHSKALASNLRSCFTDIAQSDRYLRAFNGEPVGVQEKDFTEEEFNIFRKYVRLLRSCTIMCGNDLSARYKKLFIDFFMGERLTKAKLL